MRKISIDDPRGAVYNGKPNPGTYKNFSLKDSPVENIEKEVATITFSNGTKDFNITADILEDAFIKAFDLIDKYHQNK